MLQSRHGYVMSWEKPSSSDGATAPTGGPVQPATCVCSSCLAARVNRLGRLALMLGLHFEGSLVFFSLFFFFLFFFLSGRGVIFHGCLLLLLVLFVVFWLGGGGGGELLKGEVVKISLYLL